MTANTPAESVYSRLHRPSKARTEVAHVFPADPRPPGQPRDGPMAHLGILFSVLITDSEANNASPPSAHPHRDPLSRRGGAQAGASTARDPERCRRSRLRAWGCCSPGAGPSNVTGYCHCWRTGSTHRGCLRLQAGLGVEATLLAGPSGGFGLRGGAGRTSRCRGRSGQDAEQL